MKQSGTVKFFKNGEGKGQGFGFIRSDEGKEIFVHVSGLADKQEVLDKDDRVEFEVIEGNKGPTATKVRKM